MKKLLPKFVDTHEFKYYLEEIRHNWLKTLSVLGFTLIPLFLVLDYFMIPNELFGNFAFYRSIVTVLILSQYILLRFTKPSPYTLFHGYFFSLVAGIMISLMTHKLGGFDSSYYAGLNLVMIAVIVLIPGGFVQATINAMLVIGSYLALNLFLPNPSHLKIVINNLYFLSSTAVIAVAINRVHFHLIRKEFYTNRQLVAAKKEQDTIMNTVNEGLFIIHKVDGEFVIGEHHSESVNRIIGDSFESGQKFIDILSLYFSEEKMDEVSEYLTMISSKNVDEDMIRDLSPLEREPATIDLGGNKVDKFLDFQFKRIEDSQLNSDFLISIKDVTKEVAMENELRDHKLKAEQESQMMLSMLHIGPALLEDFIAGVELELTAIESVLRDEKYHKNLASAIETIFRSVHSVKGNAALLDLGFLAEKAEEFETRMATLRNNKNLTWEDFLPIAYDLTVLQKVYGEMQELVDRIRLFQNKGSDSASALSSLPEALRKLAQKIATEFGKKVNFVMTDIDLSGVSNKYAYPLRDILVQLMRNSMTHGIEIPEVRLKSNKKEYGTISLSLKILDDTLCVDFHDDGESFDLTAIRAKAIQMGKGQEEEVNDWTPARLIKLIFEPAFSTTNESTAHSGRGMGMDIIQQKVKKIGGHFSIHYALGKFTRFKFEFPMGLFQLEKV
ncbi:MAG TPA: ATP-binding protein [Leptospiraceae bacterium]|nr:ATP-binding protein [Leptospiraceae bacterium]